MSKHVKKLRGGRARPVTPGSHRQPSGKKHYLFTDMLFGKGTAYHHQIMRIENLIVIRLPGPYQLKRLEHGKKVVMTLAFARGKS